MEALLSLDYPKELISLVWLVNDSTDGTREVLLDYAREAKDSGNYRRVCVVEKNYGFADVRKDRKEDLLHQIPVRDPDRTVDHFAHFARVRNEWLSMRTTNIITGMPLEIGNEDYYFSVDSDVVIQDPMTLLALTSLRLDLVALPVNNHENRKDGYDPTERGKKLLMSGALKDNAELADKIALGQIKGVTLKAQTAWNFGYIKNGLLRLFNPPPHLFEVDVTGACALFSKEMIEDGVKYGPYPAGEDFYFCSLAKSLGYKMEKRIAAPLSTQQFSATDVTRSKDKKVMLNILRDIVVLKNK